MEFKISLKKLLRTPVKTFLFLMLLTVTGALLSLCITLLMTARETNLKAQETFTTIAIPNYEKIKHDSVNQSNKLNDLKEKDFIESVEVMSKLYYKVLEKASETKIGKVDLRESYLAYSKDISPVLLPYSERKVINEWSMCYNMAVFELECIDTRTILFDDDLKKRNPEVEDIQVIVWKINKVFSMHPQYTFIKNIETYTTESDMNTRGLFEIGKKYLMAGYIKNFITSQELMFSESKFTDRISFFTENSFNNIALDKNINHISNKKNEEYFNSYVEIKGDTEEFLSSNEGSKFKALIENCQRINQSANVIAVGNINAVAHFNQKKAFIVNGREMTTDEYKQGDNVCLVSWQFADLNNLSVGDEINLSLSNAQYEYTLTSNIWSSPLNRIPSVSLFHSPSYSIEGEGLWFLSVNPYSMSNFKDQSYKIVGIYQSSKVELSEFMLSPNTIYVPSKSIDLSMIEHKNNNTEILEQIPTSLYSIIIPNDKLEEFKAELQEKGISQYFLYYDQGYSAVKSVLKILIQNALIILAVGLVIWILVIILFILLYIVKEKKIAGIMLSLGVGVKRTFAQLLISCILLALPSTILGGVISSALEDRVISYSYNMAIDQVMKSAFSTKFSVNADTSYNALNELDNEDEKNENSFMTSKFSGFILIAELVQLIIIICISSVFIYVMLRRNPMELVKSEE
jgi:cell division protein FtsX